MKTPFRFSEGSFCLAAVFVLVILILLIVLVLLVILILLILLIILVLVIHPNILRIYILRLSAAVAFPEI